MNVQSTLNVLCQEAFPVHLQKDIPVFQIAFMKLITGDNTMLTEFK